MRGGPALFAGRMILVSSLAAAAASGCSSRHGSEEVVAFETATGALRDHCGPERPAEVRCCEQHFPRNHRLRAVCLSESARHRGICASPRCVPPPDAGALDAGTPRDAAPADAGTARDASPLDAAEGSDASDAGNPVTCPTAVPLSAASEPLGKFSGFGLAADIGSDESVTWSVSGTSGFTLLETSGQRVDLECQGVGILTVTATVAGPGSCSLAESFSLQCSAACGNGILEPGEQCDPPDGVTCNDQCQLGPNPTCGDGLLEPGETCDRVSSRFCQNCQTTACYGCVLSLMGNNDICRSTEGAQKVACQGLEECMFSAPRGFCTSIDIPTFTCFCADATCSTGPLGPCGQALQTYLGTTDHDALVAAANSAAMTQLIVGMVAAVPCHSFCALNP